MLVTAIIIEIVAISAFIFVARKTFWLPSPVPVQAALQRKTTIPLLVILSGNLRKRSHPKALAYGAFGLVILLYSSFALAAHDALGRLDAVIFIALQMVLLV